MLTNLRDRDSRFEKIKNLEKISNEGIGKKINTSVAHSEIVNEINKEVDETRKRLNTLLAQSGNTSAGEPLKQIREQLRENLNLNTSEKDLSKKLEEDVCISDLLSNHINEFRETYSQEELNKLKSGLSEIKQLIERNKKLQSFSRILEKFEDGKNTNEGFEELTKFIDFSWDFDTFSPEFTSGFLKSSLNQVREAICSISNLDLDLHLDLHPESPRSVQEWIIDRVTSLFFGKSISDKNKEINRLNKEINRLNKNIQEVINKSQRFEISAQRLLEKAEARLVFNQKISKLIQAAEELDLGEQQLTSFDVSEDTGKAFTDILVEKYRKQGFSL